MNLKICYVNHWHSSACRSITPIQAHMAFSGWSASISFLPGLSHIGLVPTLVTSPTWGRPQLQFFRNTPVCRCVLPAPLILEVEIEIIRIQALAEGLKGTLGFSLPVSSVFLFPYHSIPCLLAVSVSSDPRERKLSNPPNLLPLLCDRSCLVSAVSPRARQSPLGESCWWGRDGAGVGGVERVA